MTTRKSYRMDADAVTKLDILKEELTNMTETDIIHHAIDAYYLTWHKQFPELFPLEIRALPK